MALQKKNVVQQFQQGEDFRPTANQSIVKYLKGVGNNLHEVSTYAGNTFLVTMPKKYRGLVYLSKGNSLVIDPIEEGNKVKGEIKCLLELSSVVQLINQRHWPIVESENELSMDRELIVEFFTKDVEMKGQRDATDMFPPISGSEDDSDEDDDEEQEDSQVFQDALECCSTENGNTAAQ